MSTRKVPLRLDLSFELPGTVEQVWAAIATADGISSWFQPTELEERVGGRIVIHIGGEVSAGTVTDFDPPRRFAYEEPDWAGFAGQADSEVTPLATEYLVEATSGGTCVVRVVTSAFGAGADWENEYFDAMEKGWSAFFENLRLYLTHFTGQRATTLSAHATVPGRGADVWAAMRERLGAAEVGQKVEVEGVTAQVELLGESHLLLRLADPPGYLMFAASMIGEPDGKTWSMIEGYLFSDDAPAFVERERPRLQTWLETLPVGASATTPGRS
jgi:uncharacterized protein YndB with AHSA1/START domain